MTYRLRDIFLGYSDGRKEALYKTDFDNYFYDYQNMVQKAKSPGVCLVLGRKGTGKSLLGEFIAKTANNLDDRAELVSFKEFRFHLLRELRTDDTAPNEYIAIWTWILLIELGKLTLKNDKLQGTEAYLRLKKFVDNGYAGLILSEHSSDDVQKLNHVEGSYLRISSKQETGSYVSFIADLEKLVEQLLTLDSGCKYTLILDELDDRFANEQAYKNSLTSLIKAADRLNVKFLKKKLMAKYLLLLRMDIFAVLNDTDLNKLKSDNCVVIDWGSWRKANYESPLFDLVVKKIQASVSELKSLSKTQLLQEVFPQETYGVDTDRYILERTFFRPRDVITYLNMVKDETRNVSIGLRQLVSGFTEAVPPCRPLVWAD